MKQNKDKQIRELKDNQRTLLILVFMGWGILIVVVVGMLVNNHTFSDVRDLEQELQSCQDKVPVWTLKIYCEISEGSFRTTMEYDFNNYQEYQDALDNVSEDCEVILE